MTTICLRCGWPLYIQSDSEFRSDEITGWASRNGIRKWTFGWPNHGQSGGWYERRHRMVVDVLRRWTLATGNLWSDPISLAYARWVINHSEIGNSGICPQLAMYGRLVTLPCMRPMDDTSGEGGSGVAHAETVSDLLQLAGETGPEHRTVVAQLLNTWLDMREQSNPSMKIDHSIKVGQLVYVYTNRPSKLEVCWRGPYSVVSLAGRSATLGTERGLETHYLGLLPNALLR
ncbi:hypothetical protein FOL47_003901 [Perkinsus chesapeaki]|uniref:Integrase catalytic domain-containing protein n=1 Tax=Perkinsus chesapeaki TaxID=330153 RepID=A0A7J6KLQ2_PERCH|nr:hypothetical protein FOL47_003901 [Perkinsus chesapeaki]